MNDRYDIVIIGAGEAGQAAANLARRRRASVAIIDRELFGGSCPFWACMPSKALLHAAAIHTFGDRYPWQRASDLVQRDAPSAALAAQNRSVAAPSPIGIGPRESSELAGGPEQSGEQTGE